MARLTPYGDLPAQLAELGVAGVDYVAALTGTDQHFPTLVEVLAPLGAVGVIDDPDRIDARLLKAKSGSPRWELMFTRSMHETPDMIEQHRLLTEVATWSTPASSPRRRPRTPASSPPRTRPGRIVTSSPAEPGGKVVLEGWPSAAD